MNDDIVELLISEETRKLGVILALENKWDYDNIINNIPKDVIKSRDGNTVVTRTIVNEFINLIINGVQNKNNISDRG